MAAPQNSMQVTAAPEVAESRTYTVTQKVALHDVPTDARSVRLWVPIAGDAAWQRVLDRRVVDAPEGWTFVRQPEGRGDLIFIETSGRAGKDGVIEVVVETVLERESPVVDLGAPAEAASGASPPFQRELFAESLRTDLPFMSALPSVQQLADQACAGVTDPRQKVIRLVGEVGDIADHYSKDPTKPHCGRGAAEDCLANGGGCCTDLHSLFIAMARSQGIPARIQFGYRLNPARAGVEYDPSYRCWVEYWIPGSGWVPTDVVVADGGEAASRGEHIGRLDANRLWLWEGRGFDLLPKQNAEPIQTMLCGWAEIDGVAVDPLPGKDNAPPQMRRTIRFTEHGAPAAAK